MFSILLFSLVFECIILANYTLLNRQSVSIYAQNYRSKLLGSYNSVHIKEVCACKSGLRKQEEHPSC